MAETPLFALLGPAGTGKTYKIQQKLLKNPRWAKLCATTGIAAINLGGAGGEGIITLQSTLGYFDTASLRENVQHGKLRRVLSALRAEHKFLVIDEMSMLDAETLDMLVEGLDGINANLSEDHGETPLGLMLVGDFMQLPPVEGEYCFEANCWKRFKVQTLTEIKRQTDPMFQELLGAARVGAGEEVADRLKAAGCFIPTPSLAGDITTIYAVNKEVDMWNDAQFRKLCATGAVRGSVSAMRWGKNRKEWKNIPESLALAVGAYVMILSNDTQDWKYANGDCGTVTSF